MISLTRFVLAQSDAYSEEPAKAATYVQPIKEKGVRVTLEGARRVTMDGKRRTIISDQ